MRLQAESTPTAPALIVPGRGPDAAWATTTWAELEHESDAYGRGFAAHGILAGDRAMVSLPPGRRLVAVLFGLWKVGAVPVWLDPTLEVHECLGCVETSAPRVLVGSALFSSLVRLRHRRVFSRIALTIHAERTWLGRGPTLASCHVPSAVPLPLVPRGASDEAMVVHVREPGGSTRAVVLHHGLLEARAAALAELVGTGRGRTVVEVVPRHVPVHLCVGATVVVPRVDFTQPWRAAAEVVAAVRDHRPDVVSASVPVWAAVVRVCSEQKLALPVRGAVASGVVPPALHRAFKRVAPLGCELWSLYGGTEGLPSAAIGSDEVLRDTAEKSARGAGICVGRAAPSSWVRVVPISDEPLYHWSTERALSTRIQGEIVVGGEQVSRAYAPVALNRLTKTAYGRRVLHRTGDLGVLDDGGRLWVRGRKSDRLVAADGTVIPPQSIEAMFDELPGVGRVALVGVGPADGTLVLCVETADGRPLDTPLKHHIEAHLRGTAVEGRLSAVLDWDRIPIDPRRPDEIRRAELRRQVADRLSGSRTSKDLLDKVPRSDDGVGERRPLTLGSHRRGK